MREPTARDIIRTHWRKMIVETSIFGLGFLVIAFGLAFMGAE